MILILMLVFEEIESSREASVIGTGEVEVIPVVNGDFFTNPSYKDTLNHFLFTSSYRYRSLISGGFIYGGGNNGYLLSFSCIPDIPLTDEEGNINGTFSFTSLYLSYRRILNRYIGIQPGINMVSTYKYLMVGIELSAGLIYPVSGRFNIGLYLKRLGYTVKPMVNYYGFTPYEVKIGSGYRDRGFSISAEYSINRRYISFGSVIPVSSPLKLTVGYTGRYGGYEKGEGTDILIGTSLGFILNYRNISFTYSYSYLGLMGDSHNISLKILKR